MQHAPPASGGMFHLEAFDENGVKVWEDVAFNKVVDGALGLFLNPLFNIARPTTQYLGLTNASPTIAAGDTMASHAGWTENQTVPATLPPSCGLVTTNCGPCAGGGGGGGGPPPCGVQETIVIDRIHDAEYGQSVAAKIGPSLFRSEPDQEAQSRPP